MGVSQRLQRRKFHIATENDGQERTISLFSLHPGGWPSSESATARGGLWQRQGDRSCKGGGRLLESGRLQQLSMSCRRSAWLHKHQFPRRETNWRSWSEVLKERK